MNRYVLFIAIHIYSWILGFLRLCAVPILSKMGKRAAWDIQARLKLPYAEKDCRERRTVWIHAASLGESKVLYGFLGILRHKYPDDLYVVTAVTRSGVDYLRRCRPDSVAAAGFLPLDTIGLMRGMLKKFNISRVWLTETELWPAMLWSCMDRGIPTGMVNGRMEQRSFAWFRRFRKLLTPLFAFLDPVLAQSTTYADRFKALGVPENHVHVVGNIKGHVQIRRPDREMWSSLRASLNIAEETVVLTAGCVHPGEGAVLRRALSILAKNDFHCKCVAVPRHVESVPKLIEELGDGVLLLRGLDTTSSWEICLIEKYGIMDDMYAIADIAFVGGTFVEVGGHNIWDAARYGIPVLFGPDYHTQKESCERILAAGIGFMVNDAEELAHTIIRVLKNDAKAFIGAQRAFTEELSREQSVLDSLIP